MSKPSSNSSPEISQALLHELLHYDPDTGVFTWKKRDRKWFSADHHCDRWNRRYAKRPTGTLDTGGYPQIKIFGHRYHAHRLAWLFITGRWPTHCIDHRNAERSDNRWQNLQEATRAQNQQKRQLPADHSIGTPGVYFDRRTKKWRARMGIACGVRHLGSFTNIEDAITARRDAEKKYHNSFAHHLQNFS